MEEAAAGAAPPQSETDRGPRMLDDIVEDWWAEHFPGSPVALTTPAWNHAFAAKEALKRRLATLDREGN